MIRRALSVALVASTLVAGGVVQRSEALEEDRIAAVAQLQALSDAADSSRMRGEYLAGAIDITQQDVAERTAVLEVRPGFVTEVTALGAALTGAQGKVDTATHRASALSTQQTVLAEKTDPATVVAATATIHALTAKVGEEVATWQAEQDALAAQAAEAARSARSGRGPSSPPSSSSSSSSGPDGYARVRAALDRVGGGGVGLYESGSCAGGSAPACANSDGYIKYRSDIASWGSGRLNWVMAHELAHIYQFRVWNAMTASDSYQSLFGGDPEFLANCMAAVRGFAGSVGCNGDQQAWASGIWVGAVR